MKKQYVGDGQVYLIAGGNKIYTDIAARFVRSEKPVKEIIDSPYNPQIVRNILESGHGAALEFDYFIFGVEGYSRVCETQLVRKRMASYLIKSGRQELGGKRQYSVVLPKSIMDADVYYSLSDKISIDTTLNSDGIVVARNINDNMIKLNPQILNEMIEYWYNESLASGKYKEEDLRYMKPLSTEFKAILGFNAHALHDIAKIRCCFDDQTEVLTTDGWKYFKDLTGDELFYSMNPEDRVVEYVKAKELIIEQYKGPMVHVNSKRLDLCTTPNHNNLVSILPSNATREDWRMFVRKENANNLQFVKAKDMNNYSNVRMTRTCKYVKFTNCNLYTSFPEVDTTYYPRGKKHKEFTILTSEFMKLLGLYLSDGSIAHKVSKKDGLPCDKHVQISKGKYITCFRYATMVSNWLGYNVPIYKTGENVYSMNIYSPQLYDMFKTCGTKATEKHIPKWVWDMAPIYQLALLVGFLDGDTGLGADGHGSYSTVSKQLADDFQRLLLHCGLSGSIRVRSNDHVSEGILNGKPYRIQGKHPIYCIQFTLQRVNSEPVIVGNERNNISSLDYNGKVYCVELEKFHTLYVRRNGTPVWSGNCLNAQTEIRDLVSKMVKLAKEAAPDLFENIGPSCKVLGYCPEGRLQNEKCKGKIPTKQEMIEGYKNWKQLQDDQKRMLEGLKGDPNYKHPGAGCVTNPDGTIDGCQCGGS